MRVGIFSWTLLAVALSSCGRPARRVVELAARPDTGNERRIEAKRHFKKGAVFFDRGDAGGAQIEYMKALRADPGLYRAHLGLGEVYELEGDRVAALAEHVAHTETARRSREYLDYMYRYVFDKMSRDPAGPRESDRKTRAAAMLDLSEAVALYRQGKYAAVPGKLASARRGLPRAGIFDYLEAYAHLQNGETAAALDAFVRAAGRNPFFARRLLAARDKRLPAGLNEGLTGVLRYASTKHPADLETAFLLSGLLLRAGLAADSLGVVQRSLVWSHAGWELLLIKAASYRALGQKIQMQQALSDLVAAKPDFSDQFGKREPSVFRGLLAGRADELATGELAGMMPEPARSYFLWRLLQERGDAAADASLKAFSKKLQATFPADEFTNLPCSKPPENSPGSLQEFMGTVQERIDTAMDALLHCDQTLRPRRDNPSGRVMLRVLLGRDGSVAQAGVLENTTRDGWLAYCMINKILAMRFPAPLRANESFKLPVMVGPGTDTN
ncbi:MAG TPA: hypothetical protein VM425_05025 [Myxococcota bacterium]|nr:hypothetical protein [Myxococcota bacterium]